MSWARMGPGERKGLGGRLLLAEESRHDLERMVVVTRASTTTPHARTPLRYHTRKRGCSGYAFFERRRLIFARRRVFLFQSSPPPVTGAGAGAGTVSRMQRPSTQFPLAVLLLQS